MPVMNVTAARIIYAEITRGLLLRKGFTASTNLELLKIPTMIAIRIPHTTKMIEIAMMQVAGPLRLFYDISASTTLR